jgi:hypothetical protein
VRLHGGLPWFFCVLGGQFIKRSCLVNDLGTPRAKLAGKFKLLCNFVWLECGPTTGTTSFSSNAEAKDTQQGDHHAQAAADFSGFHFIAGS